MVVRCLLAGIHLSRTTINEQRPTLFSRIFATFISRMNLLLYNIIPQLQPYIKVICSMESEGSNDHLSPFRVLPDTCIELFLNYIQPEQTIATGNNNILRQPQSFIVSRMSRYMEVQNHGRTGCIAICFHPGAATHFFKTSMNELSDTVTALNDLWKDVAKEMEERIGEAHSNEERVDIVQQYLVKQLAKNNKKDKQVENWLWQVNLYKGTISVKELSKKVNISERQLGRRFNQLVGLSPKEFTRVTRFIHSLTYLKQNPHTSLTDVAHESGYYDQAHFIHDCREYAGCTPGELGTSCNILF